MVKRLQISDDQTYLMLTAGYLFDLETLRNRQGTYQRPLKSAPLPAGSPEIATAWALTATCRAKSSGMVYKGGRMSHPMEAPFHTWVFGPPQHTPSALEPFFRGKSETESYRVFLHYKPNYISGRHIEIMWGQVYRQPPKLIRCTCAHFDEEERRTGRRFLELALTSYQREQDGMQWLAQISGHLFWFSDGALPD